MKHYKVNNSERWGLVDTIEGESKESIADSVKSMFDDFSKTSDKTADEIRFEFINDLEEME